MDTPTEFRKTIEQLSKELKKRLLRKTPLTQSERLLRNTDALTSLARSLDQQACPELAAQCHLALAQCHQSCNATSTSAAEAFLQAARFYMKTHKNHLFLRSGSFHEHLVAAVQWYNYAVRSFIDLNKYGLASSTLVEIAEELIEVNAADEAVSYLMRALEMHSKSGGDAIRDFELLIKCFIISKEFQNALHVTNSFYEFVQSQIDNDRLAFMRPHLCNAEVLLFLLVVLNQIEPAQQTTEQKKICVQFKSDDLTNPHPHIRDELYFALKSVALSVDLKCSDYLSHAVGEAYPYVNHTQRLAMDAFSKNLVF